MAAFVRHGTIYERWNHSDVVLDCLFLIDMLLWFGTPFVDYSGSLQSSWKKTIRQYLTGWFFPDLIMLLPIYLIADYYQHDLSIQALGILNSMRILK